MGNVKKDDRKCNPQHASLTWCASPQDPKTPVADLDLELFALTRHPSMLAFANMKTTRSEGMLLIQPR